jgi:hypothetical protein
MTNTSLAELLQEQFDAYCEYRFTEAKLSMFKEQNPNYENELTLWVESMNIELEIKTKKYLYEVAMTKWAIEETKQNFVESEDSVSL